MSRDWENEKKAREALLNDRDNAALVEAYAAVIKVAIYKSCVKLIERTPLLAATLLACFLFVDEDGRGASRLGERLAEMDPEFDAWWNAPAFGSVMVQLVTEAEAEAREQEKFLPEGVDAGMLSYEQFVKFGLVSSKNH